MNIFVQEFTFKTLKPNRESNFINRVWFNGESAQLLSLITHLKNNNNIHYPSLIEKLREVDEFYYEYCCVKKNDDGEVGYFNPTITPFFITDLATIQQLCPKVQHICLRTYENGATHKVTFNNHSRMNVSICFDRNKSLGTNNTLIFASVFMHFNNIGSNGSMNDLYGLSTNINQFFNNQRKIKRRVITIYKCLQHKLPIEIICSIIEHYLDDGQQKIYPNQLRYLLDMEYKEELEVNDRKRKRGKYLAFNLRTDHPKRVLSRGEFYRRSDNFNPNIEYKHLNDSTIFNFSEGIH